MGSGFDRFAAIGADRGEGGSSSGGEPEAGMVGNREAGRLPPPPLTPCARGEDVVGMDLGDREGEAAGDGGAAREAAGCLDGDDDEPA